jgi:hypothetical protein
MDRTVAESLWRRGLRDALAARESKLFWGIEVIGAPVVGIWDGPITSIVFIVGVVLVVWVRATVAAPIRQRDEARTTVKTLQRAVEGEPIEVKAVHRDKCWVHLEVMNRGDSDRFEVECLLPDVEGRTETSYRAAWRGIAERGVQIQRGGRATVNLVEIDPIDHAGTGGQVTERALAHRSLVRFYSVEADYFDREVDWGDAFAFDVTVLRDHGPEVAGVVSVLLVPIETHRAVVRPDGIRQEQRERGYEIKPTFHRQPRRT